MNEQLKGKLKFHLVEEKSGAKIKVIGIGGGGGNAVNRMIETGIEGVEFITINTDLQALDTNKAQTKYQIGKQLTKGLGSGGSPNTGKEAAVEDMEQLRNMIEGADMVFLTSGLGGGTGTGATPILAKLASEMDILAIAIVTLPFCFEGKVRSKQADEGLADLKNVVDTVISIPNERLLETVNLNTSIQDAFKLADDILRQAVQGISDLITRPGLINLDFADVKSVMKGMGMAFLGTGMAAGENRAIEGAQRAISSPLLIDNSIEGAHGVLINITGGTDVTLHEVSKASDLIYNLVHPDANIIFGTVIDETMKDTVKVTVIATGFDDKNEAETIQTDELPPIQRPTPPPVQVPQNTPPYLFEPQNNASLGKRPAWESQWDPYETPSFIRKNKKSSLRKVSHEVS
ncbi:cell division protein FtsZ [Acidobacteriota bacterium]